ncbi:hypothetical protein [Nocardioides sp.]|jgi:hypothetical protein|uniref:hypothetical protein n=1 Tax=Nocardioides sp. TaxID=35761 RepID=UPI0031FF37FB|nr:hypothetical protein [Nocardioides sp.]
MTETRCEQTELPVSMCSCRIHEVRPAPLVAHQAPSGKAGGGPSKSAILISRKGIAHHYGCHHLPDYAVLVPPDWGWIEDASSWPKIGGDAQAATGGNLNRSAMRRCGDCA